MSDFLYLENIIAYKKEITSETSRKRFALKFLDVINRTNEYYQDSEFYVPKEYHDEDCEDYISKISLKYKNSDCEDYISKISLKSEDVYKFVEYLSDFDGFFKVPNNLIEINEPNDILEYFLDYHDAEYFSKWEVLSSCFKKSRFVVYDGGYWEIYFHVPEEDKDEEDIFQTRSIPDGLVFVKGFKCWVDEYPKPPRECRYKFGGSNEVYVGYHNSASRQILKKRIKMVDVYGTMESMYPIIGDLSFAEKMVKKSPNNSLRLKYLLNCLELNDNICICNAVIDYFWGLRQNLLLIKMSIIDDIFWIIFGNVIDGQNDWWKLYYLVVSRVHSWLKI